MSSVACRRSEGAQGAGGELGPEEQRLERRDQRVAAENGHEPRHARRGELPDAVDVP